jgi:hypothetical protein
MTLSILLADDHPLLKQLGCFAQLRRSDTRRTHLCKLVANRSALSIMLASRPSCRNRPTASAEGAYSALTNFNAARRLLGRKR